MIGKVLPLELVMLMMWRVGTNMHNAAGRVDRKLRNGQGVHRAGALRGKLPSRRAVASG